MTIAKKIFKRGKTLINIITGRELRYNVQTNCLKEDIGTEYGGWSIFPDNITEESIVYSFGVGEDISFDLGMIEKFGVNIYAFDPTPRSIEWVKAQTLPDNFHFFEYGIAGYDGIAKFYPPDNPEHVSHTMIYKENTAHKMIEVKVYKLKTILSMLWHQRIDILKMDIEGAEYEVIDDLVSEDIEIYQLLVEFHHRLKNVGLEKTKRAINLLNEKGFKIFDIASDGDQYSFIRV